MIESFLASGNILGIEENPGRPNQKIYIVEIESMALHVGSLPETEGYGRFTIPL